MNSYPKNRAICLVIDELGPLEFSDHEGYLAAFDCLKNQNYRKALVVIRPECIEAFQSFGLPFSIIEIEKADADSMKMNETYFPNRIFVNSPYQDNCK